MNKRRIMERMIVVCINSENASKAKVTGGKKMKKTQASKIVVIRKKAPKMFRNFMYIICCVTTTVGVFSFFVDSKSLSFHIFLKFIIFIYWNLLFSYCKLI